MNTINSSKLNSVVVVKPDDMNLNANPQTSITSEKIKNL